MPDSHDGTKTHPILNMTFLMHFREVYLRIIAAVWEDWENLDIPGSFAYNVLYNGKEDFDKYEKTLRKTLKDRFGTVGFPDHLDVEFLYKKPEYKKPEYSSNNAHWASNRGWIAGKDGDRLELHLPLEPPSIKWHPGALADFYRQYSGTILPANNGEFIHQPNPGSPEPFLALGGYLMDALALAWRDKTFREAVEFQPSKATLPTDFYKSEQALTRWLGYTNPWNVRVVIIKAGNAKWQSHTQNKNDVSPGHWTGIPNPRIVLQFPGRPQDDDDIFPIALSAYNQTGPAYPFTCPS